MSLRGASPRPRLRAPGKPRQNRNETHHSPHSWPKAGPGTETASGFSPFAPCLARHPRLL